MAFSGNFACTVFKTGLMSGAFDFTTEQFYIALYTNAATLTANTTEYTSNGEVTASGYAARALQVTTDPTTGPSGNIAYISFADVTWEVAMTARGALIYKPGANGAVCVLDFGNDKTSVTDFTVQFPPATNTSAIIRLA